MRVYGVKPFFIARKILSMWLYTVYKYVNMVLASPSKKSTCTPRPALGVSPAGSSME
jgi:hypothetical protein